MNQKCIIYQCKLFYRWFLKNYVTRDRNKEKFLLVRRTSDHVRLTCPPIFSLVKNHASINTEPQVSQNKHNNNAIRQLLHVASYYYLLSQSNTQHIRPTFHARVYKNGVLGPGSEFLKTGPCQKNGVPNVCISNKI